jgi:streptogramin lyase
MLMGFVFRIRTRGKPWKGFLRTSARARGRNPRPWLEGLETRALMANITEYPITVGSQSLGNGLVGITGGPDGNVYFTDTLNNAIGQITPSGAIKELLLPPANGGGFFKNGLDGITLGADNKLAFTESTQGAIGKMTTTGSYNQGPIDSTGKSTGQGPDQITKSSDGTLWWTEDGADAIGELSPAGLFHEYPVEGATHGGIIGPSMKGITAGPDGNIWFTNWGSSGDFIGMITPAGKITEFPLSFATDPYGIASGPDGNLWFIAYGSNTIDVMSTSGTILHEYPVAAAPGTGGLGQLEDITVGPDNNLYFTAQTGYIGEITTSGLVAATPVSTTINTVPGASGPQPLAITSGPDGNIWFTDPWTDSIGVLKIATFVVTNTGDSAAPGSGSFRRAILDSNAATGGTNTISFAIGTGSQMIAPTSALPAITHAVDIDATTQPGYSGSPVIVLNGGAAGSGVDGLDVTASGCTIKGLVINGFGGNGIVITAGARSNVIAGNFIGTDALGTEVVPNLGSGVWIGGGAQSNLIGTNGDGIGDLQERNLISGNLRGITITDPNTNNNVVAGNWIGTDSSGAAALGNRNYGVWITNGAESNRIGVSSSNAGAAAERNVIAASAADGVAISQAGTSDNVVSGNFIGTDASGTQPLGNVANGVSVFFGAQSNQIGTDGTDINSTFQVNVIAANGFNGIIISDHNTDNNVVAGNFIGTDVTGKAALGNATTGILVRRGAAANLIGGSNTRAGNVISGNSVDGIQVTDQGTSNNLIEGNLIGLASDGASSLGNVGDGLTIESSASGNTIGGTTTGAGNTIAYNTIAGIAVLGASTIQDTIRDNAIFDNGGPGIDLEGDGVTPNHGNTAASGPNNLENYPVITAASSGTTTSVSISFVSLPNGRYTIDFYESPAPDPSGYGQGQRYLGAVSVTTDANGQVDPPTTLDIPATTDDGQWITATATDQAGNTSEFSNAWQLVASPPMLVIQTQPSSFAIAGQPFAIQPVIYVEDQDGNLETNDNSTVVTASLASGDGPLQGTTSVTVQGGIATFDNLADNTFGIISLTFSSDIGTAGPSTIINVLSGGPYQLLIQTQPSSTAIAGEPFAMQPSLYELDRYGNLETGDSSTAITVSLASGNGPLHGTTIVYLVDGIATFTDLADNKAGIISLNFSGAGMTAGPSNNIFISPATAANLMIQTQPNAQVTAGDKLTDPIVIDEEDKYGNIETDDNSTPVTASLASGAGLLKGIKTATVAAGVASFDDLEDDTAGPLTLQFAAGALPPVISNPSQVSPAAAMKLVVVSQPTTASAGNAFGFTVYAEDPFGNIDATYNSSVTVELAVPGGSIGGTTTVTAANGVATFTNLVATTSGSISLNVTSGALTGVSSSTFPVAPALAAKLVIHTQPSQTVTAGEPLAIQPVIYEEDQYGNLVTDDNSTPVTVSLASGAGSLQGAQSVTVQGGVATFNSLDENTAGKFSLQFAGGGFSPVSSEPIVVTPAAPSKLVIQTEPSANGTADQAFTTQPVIYEEDQFGNLETSDNTTLITASLASGAGPLQGAPTVKLSGGVAAFTGLSDRTPETITLRFFNAILTSPASSAIRITANAPTASVTIASPRRKKNTSTVIKIQYSTNMDSSSASSHSNYQLFATTGKGKKKKTSPVKFSPAFAPSTNTVTLTVTGKKNPFATGGQLKIVASSPGGVKSQAGAFLIPSDISFKISANAKSITRG